MPIAVVALLRDLPEASYDDLVADLRGICPAARSVLVIDGAAWTTSASWVHRI